MSQVPLFAGDEQRFSDVSINNVSAGHSRR
jgi:hypothetical protein